MHGSLPPIAGVAATYDALDFSLAGPPARELHAGIDHDLALPRLRLSDHAGAVPADLTPNMASWYRAQVEGPRRAALDAVEAQAARLNQVASGSGIFLERELDRAEDERLTAKRQVVASHAEKNQAAIQRLETLTQSYAGAKRRFESLSARHGRAPKIVRWWYYALLVVIGIAEFMINFESLNAIRIFTPAIATGTAVVLSIAVALSSHYFGTLLKQFAVLSDPAQNDSDRWPIVKMLGIGTVTLLFALGVVWYARASYFADIVSEQAILTGEAPSWIKVIGGSLISNLLVWAVGVLIAYAVHDPDPHYPDAFLHMGVCERAMRTAREKLDKPLQREFQQIDTRAKNRRTAAQNQHESHGNLAEHQQARRLFEKVAEQDARVMSVLEAYRRELVRRIAASAPPPPPPGMPAPPARFERAPQVYAAATDLMDAADYVALPLRVKYL